MDDQDRKGTTNARIPRGVFEMTTDFQILHGDALAMLKTLPDESVQCCVTSPPYFGLRDYQTAPLIWESGEFCDHKEHQWVETVTPAANGLVNNPMQGETLSENSATRSARASDFCSRCNSWRGSLGLEPTPQLFVEHLTQIFLEVRRVLKKDGTLWLNLGDSYAGSGRGRDADGTWNPGKGGSKQETNVGAISGRVVNPNSLSRKHIEAGAIGNAWVKPPAGFKQKDLMGMPWRVAFALQDAGFWLRQDIIWAKPNPMPESVTDRCTKAHEYIFLLTKSAKYYYDQDAIKEPLKDASVARLIEENAVRFGGNKYGDSDEGGRTYSGNEWKPKGRDRTAGNRNGEGASTLDIKVRPHGIVRDRLLDYDSKEKQLRPNTRRGGFENEADLRKDWDAKMAGAGGINNRNRSGYFDRDTGEAMCGIMANKKSVWTVTTQPFKDAHFATFPPKLIEPMILAGSREGDLVLDPFSGSGTTGLVALRNKRRYIGIELNEDYIEMSKRRLQDVQVNLF